MVFDDNWKREGDDEAEIRPVAPWQAARWRRPGAQTAPRWRSSRWARDRPTAAPGRASACRMCQMTCSPVASASRCGVSVAATMTPTLTMSSQTTAGCVRSQPRPTRGEQEAHQDGQRDARQEERHRDRKGLTPRPLARGHRDRGYPVAGAVRARMVGQLARLRNVRAVGASDRDRGCLLSSLAGAHARGYRCRWMRRWRSLGWGMSDCPWRSPSRAASRAPSASTSMRRRSPSSAAGTTGQARSSPRP